MTNHTFAPRGMAPPLLLILIVPCFLIQSSFSFGIVANFTCAGCSTSSLTNNDAIIYENNFYCFTFSPWEGPSPVITGTFSAVSLQSSSFNGTTKSFVSSKFVDVPGRFALPFAAGDTLYYLWSVFDTHQEVNLTTVNLNTFELSTTSLHGDFTPACEFLFATSAAGYFACQPDDTNNTLFYALDLSSLDFHFISKVEGAAIFRDEARTEMWISPDEVDRHIPFRHSFTYPL